MTTATVVTPRPHPHPPRLRRLRAVFLLGGSVRPEGMVLAAQRPLFNLPLQEGMTILDGWRREAKQLSEMLGEETPVRLMIDQGMATPAEPAARADLAAVRIERDPTHFRGTGGVLRDVAAEYGDDDWVLAANANQVLFSPLTHLVDELAEAGGDVNLISNDDGTPGGVFLLRCGAMRSVPDAGFFDFKEQALELIVKAHTVMVVRHSEAAGLPVRTRISYIEALRRHHRLLAGREIEADPFAEDTLSSFALVEDGAEVDPSARLHNAVVLRGGRVESGAVVANSIVCPGATARRGARIVDDVVAPAGMGRRPAQEARA